MLHLQGISLSNAYQTPCKIPGFVAPFPSPKTSPVSFRRHGLSYLPLYVYNTLQINLFRRVLSGHQQRRHQRPERWQRRRKMLWRTLIGCSILRNKSALQDLFPFCSRHPSRRGRWRRSAGTQLKLLSYDYETSEIRQYLPFCLRCICFDKGPFQMIIIQFFYEQCFVL